ncbi:MAG: efflux RND transporter periplasmic adaptor subunit, partial [Pseudomonadota bacterium]
MLQPLKLLAIGALALGFSQPVAAQDAIQVKLIKVTEAASALERVFFGRVKARQTIDLAFQVR